MRWDRYREGDRVFYGALEKDAGRLAPGDTIEVRIGSIGALRCGIGRAN